MLKQLSDHGTKSHIVLKAFENRVVRQVALGDDLALVGRILGHPALHFDHEPRTLNQNYLDILCRGSYLSQIMAGEFWTGDRILPLDLSACDR